MQIRTATPADAGAIAAIHVSGWQETYRRLLPDALLDGLSVPRREVWWRRRIEAGAAVQLAPGAGFAMLAGQRDAALATEWPDELHALYVLKSEQGRGLGLALLRAAVGPEPRPFSAFVLQGNERALEFYRRSGAEELFRRPDLIDGHPIVDILLGWRDPRTIRGPTR